ncbi:MAG: hypothetical protein GTN90_13870 [Xanthomonadales bacterium]|nr:hypothetical protein [Xanthomonadales bacterium]
MLRAVLFSFAVCLSMLPGAAAAQPDNPVVYTDREGQAIRGYDPVAYFAAGEPVPGNPAYSFDWQGAKWLFASVQNRDTFAGNPDRYAPQFGGYCAYAVSQGHVLDSNPKVWSVTDGKLYLFLGKDAQAKWSQDIRASIARAVNNWPSALVDEGRRKAIADSGGDR